MLYNYLSFVYWFNSRPAPLGTDGKKVIIAILAVLVIGAIILHLRAYSRKLHVYRIAMARLIPFCWTNVLIGLAFLFFNYELTPVFRARVWYIIWGIGSLIWLWRIFRGRIRHAETDALDEREAIRRKYLPK